MSKPESELEAAYRRVQPPRPMVTEHGIVMFTGISNNPQWSHEAARAGLRRAMANGKGYSRNEGY